MSLTIGIDSGSTATKGSCSTTRTAGASSAAFWCRPLSSAGRHRARLGDALYRAARAPHLTLTGYGRDLASFADRRVTEISCHGLGARLLCPSVYTVIDIGGQDSKVIQLDGEGNLTDFLMNDKCAAGTLPLSRGDHPHPGGGGRAARRAAARGRASRHQQHVHRVCRIGGDQSALGGHSYESILAGIVRSMARRSANFIYASVPDRRCSLPAASATAPPSAIIWRKDWAVTWPPTRTPSLPVRWGRLCSVPAPAREANHERRVPLPVPLYPRHAQAAQAAGAAAPPFRVCDVPRRLSAGCGLAIRLHCPPEEWQQWCQRGETAAVFRCDEDGEYCELARYPTAG